MKKLRAYLESGLKSIPDGVVMLDTRGRFIYANSTTLKKLGRREKDLIGKTLSEVSPSFMSPETVKIMSGKIKNRLETGKSITNAEMKILGKGGNLRQMSYSASVVRDEKGKIVGELVFLRDVTDIKRMQDALKEAEEKYKAIFEKAYDAIMVADVKTGAIIDANKAAEKLVGRTRKELIGMNRLKLHPHKKANYYKKHFQKHIRLKSAVDFNAEAETKSGKVIPVSISAVVMKIGGRKVIQGIFKDMTELRRAEEERKKLTKELVTVSGNVTEAVKKMSDMYRKRIAELEKMVAQLSKSQ